MMAHHRFGHRAYARRGGILQARIICCTFAVRYVYYHVSCALFVFVCNVTVSKCISHACCCCSRMGHLTKPNTGDHFKWTETFFFMLWIVVVVVACSPPFTHTPMHHSYTFIMGLCVANTYARQQWRQKRFLGRKFWSNKNFFVYKLREFGIESFSIFSAFQLHFGVFCIRFLGCKAKYIFGSGQKCGQLSSRIISQFSFSKIFCFLFVVVA